MSESFKKREGGPGVGMPAALLLDEFGSQVWSAFGSPPYLVGSALAGKEWRDVDVRVILTDEEYEQMGLGDPRHPHRNAKWVAVVLAFSALGKAMTGLPIDFQIQQQTAANKEHDRPRSALGIIPLRMMDQPTGRKHVPLKHPIDESKTFEMEPCCDCGEDYPRADLRAGEVLCPACRRKPNRLDGQPTIT